MAGVKETRAPSPPVSPRQVVITIGVHSDDASADHGDDVTVGDVATWMEFGTRTIPQRSFIRGWFDENQTFIRDTLQKQFAGVATGKRTAEIAAERCALAFEGAVKQRIARGIPPPLAASTIARKGSSKPLINTGQLRGSIRGKVEAK